MLDWCMARGRVISAFIAVMILILPTVFPPLLRSYLNSMADQRISQLYHTPYGLDNYARNQISQPGHVYRLEMLPPAIDERAEKDVDHASRKASFMN